MSGTIQRETVRAIIMHEGAMLALLQGERGDRPPQCYPPGGEVHFGEALEEAVKREVREETGCCVLRLRHLGSVIKGDKPEVIHVFVVEVCRGLDITLNEESQGYFWLDCDEIHHKVDNWPLVSERYQWIMGLCFQLQLDTLWI